MEGTSKPSALFEYSDYWIAEYQNYPEPQQYSVWVGWITDHWQGQYLNSLPMSRICNQVDRYEGISSETKLIIIELT